MELTRLYHLKNGELRLLIDSDRRLKVSLMMPVQQEPDKRDENRIRLKNLLQAAEEQLQSMALRNPEIEQLLAPAEELIGGGRFQDITRPGLAIYLAGNHARAYQIPYAPQEAVVLGSQFLITPLIPLRNLAYCYILALSQQSIRLLQATEYRVTRLELNDMPQSLEEALRWDDPEKQLQWHSKTASESDGRAAAFHGHGVATKETHKENLLRYFQLLDQGISKLLSDETAPLILAGVDYLLPIYRQANSYGYLLEEEIVGSQEHLRDEEIQTHSLPILQAHFRAQREEVLRRYHELADNDLASADLTTVMRAAYQARVDTLLVMADEQRWGEFDENTGHVRQVAEMGSGAVDLLNLATIHTLLNDGAVYAWPPEEMPSGEPVAALLRF